jgi:hypothetical protein
LNWPGKTPIEIARFMILVIVGRTEEHCIRREVEIGSKSQFVGETEIKEAYIETSSILTKVKDEKLGGVKGCGI